MPRGSAAAPPGITTSLSVRERVSPDAVGQDIRSEELKWWTQVRSAFPDMQFTVGLLVESDDLVVSNWTEAAVRAFHPPSLAST